MPARIAIGTRASHFSMTTSDPMTVKQPSAKSGPKVVSVAAWAWWSIGIDIVLASLHCIIAAASGSLAVTAEAIHNFADLAAAVGVLIGVKLATRKTEVFPYGLYKMENLVAAGMALMVFFTAYELVRSAFFETARQLRLGAWMPALLLVTAAIPLLFSGFEQRAAQLANSPALLAEAREYRVHGYTTGLAFAALLSAWFKFPLDRFAALIIVAAVVKTGWSLLVDALRVLLDASLSGNELTRIRQAIEADQAVSEVKWVIGRNAGRFCFVEAGVALRLFDLVKAEAAVQRIERDVRSVVPRIERALLHVEAPASTHVRYAVPLVDPSGTLSDHFGEAPYFAFVTVERASDTVVEQRVRTNPHRTLEKRKGIQVAEWLVGEKVDIVLVRKEVKGKGPGYVLRDAGIQIKCIDKPTLAEAFFFEPREKPRDGSAETRSQTDH